MIFSLLDKKPDLQKCKNHISGSKVLVAGGAGFIGSSLCELLLACNATVYCLDNLITGSKNSIDKLTANPRFKFLQLDINGALNSTIGKIDYIFHLAGDNQNLDALSLSTLMTNSLGTRNLLELARACNSKFLLVSTANIYYELGLDKDYPAPSLLEGRRFSETLVMQYVREFSLDARIVRLADVYGPGMNLSARSTVNQLISQGLYGNEFIVIGDGLEVVHPTFIDDAIEGIVKVFCLDGGSGQIFTLLNPREVTVVQFINILQGLLPAKKEVNFQGGAASTKLALGKADLDKNDHNLNWYATTSLDHGLAETLDSFLSTQQHPSIGYEPNIGPLVAVDNNHKKPWLGKAIVYCLVLLIVLFGVIPGMLAVYQLWQGQKLIGQAVVSLEASQFELARQYAQSARDSLAQTSQVLLYYRWTAGVGQKQLHGNLTSFLSSGQHVAKALTNASDAALNFKSFGQIISSNGATTQANVLLDSADNFLTKAKTEIQLAQAELKTLTAGDIKLISKVGDFKMLLDKVDLKLDQAKAAVSIMPSFLGLDKQKSYLLLFQNNAELRPGGGFIGSYGVLTTNKGKVVDLAVSDIYVADGNLKEVITPPAPLKTYLEQSRWYLRDSNWSLDFPTNARQALSFFDKEIGKKVDGVIAIDLNVLKDMLDIIGPVNLTDFGGEINSRNIFEKAEYYSEVGFFPGSTNKRDFLSALSRQILMRVSSIEFGQWPKLLSAFQKNLEQKHLLVWFGDAQISQTIHNQNWDGAVQDMPCDSVSICDWLAIVEANVGANKANYFLKRSMDINNVIAKTGEVSNQLIITYSNQSPSQTWPAGRYRAWVRVLVPLDSQLTSLVIDGQESSIIQVVKAVENNRHSYGFLVDVAVGETKRVAVEYQNSGRLPLDNMRSSYSLYIQKQPGTDQDPVQVRIDYPGFLKPDTAVDGDGVVKEGTISYTNTLSTDQTFKIGFLR
ncbi:DUF4012 domain-containing protein [Candidatus Daviesbacteria bacterium]|nr:DUF4012 domain-containing protein [Candidatus Daviesbacteria bacterium]